MISESVKKAYEEDPSIKEKIVSTHRGAKRSEETKKRMSEAQKGRIPSNKIYNSEEEKRKVHNERRKEKRKNRRKDKI